MLKLCLTGGPGAGKTVIFNHLARVLEERGYFVFFIPDTIPELMMNGIRPDQYISNLAFYNFVLEKQMEKEKLYNHLAQYYPREKIVIVCDRGILDIGAAVGKPTLEGMLQKKKMTLVDACDYYDAVIHLTTAAAGAMDFYQWADPDKSLPFSNLAIESPSEAIRKDNLIKEIWSVHPSHHIIHTHVNFSDKIFETMCKVLVLLGEKAPSHKMKKYVIQRPDEELLNNMEVVSKVNVIQTYLIKHSEDVDRRLIKRGNKDTGFTFYYVEKVDIGKENERFVTEKQITMQEYSFYLSEVDKSIPTVSKVRRGISYNGKYYEIETYMFDKEYAILEVEHDINIQKSFLPFKIIEDVTNDRRYSSRELAKRHGFPTSAPRTLASLKDTWIYETGREERGFGKEDTRFYGVEITTDEKEAFRLFSERNRTYLIRYKESSVGRIYQWYDIASKTWNED